LLLDVSFTPKVRGEFVTVIRLDFESSEQSRRVVDHLFESLALEAELVAPVDDLHAVMEEIVIRNLQVVGKVDVECEGRRREGGMEEGGLTVLIPDASALQRRGERGGVRECRAAGGKMEEMTHSNASHTCRLNMIRAGRPSFG